MTAADAFAAGWADGATDRPLTPSEVAQMVQLHARHLRDDSSSSARSSPAPLPRRA